MQNPLFPGNTFSEQDSQGSGSKRTVNRQDLNPSQYEAVTYLDGPLLVVAGAGSGKTRTLVYRVAHLLELGILPENLLLLTFTRRAAQEML
jgi:DNA helicase-2/ATP-dependent DNA helicase PcrA